MSRISIFLIFWKWSPFYKGRAFIFGKSCCILNKLCRDHRLLDTSNTRYNHFASLLETFSIILSVHASEINYKKCLISIVYMHIPYEYMYVQRKHMDRFTASHLWRVEWPLVANCRPGMGMPWTRPSYGKSTFLCMPSFGKAKPFWCKQTIPPHCYFCEKRGPILTKNPSHRCMNSSFWSYNMWMQISWKILCA